ncbi:arsenate reductase [Lampropedia cohaerens]|uniref:Arsenate reductase n=1 Tax=Lampropedia cohaerens TaxID=1610491 RepID=A0A0U1Q2L1_9BURK|nr:arsenate reductase (glutaredoxin) [Lampropedia cohaerens]KKW69003.1 arsenate reductase [Lampropedia cohaerens]
MTDKTATIYHNSRCSTSRKALQLLREHGYAPHIVEYLKTPLTRQQLAALIAAAGLEVREAVRTKEPLYAELDLADASDEVLLDTIAEHPILLNRPFVVTEKGTMLARPLEALQAIL